MSSQALNVIGAVLCAIAVLAQPGCGESPSETTGASQKSALEALRRHSSRAPESLIRMINLARTAPEPVPGRLREQTKMTLGANQPRLSFSRAQAVQTAHGSLWLIEGGSVVCLLHGETGVISCANLAEVADRGITLGVWWPKNGPGSPPGKHAIFGVVPDSVQAVSLRAGEETRIAKVQRNSFSAKSTRPLFVGHLMRSPR
jgi:hypothetical protein